ncbi:MAG: c-type cytochrome biogenesis protein CcmI, partial [Methylocella sp.]
MLWLIFAVFTAVAVLSVLWPLAKTPRGVARGEIGIAIYKAQLAEIERDEAQRLVAPEDAQDTKAEAARRLIAADAAIEPPAAAARSRAQVASVGVLIF